MSLTESINAVQFILELILILITRSVAAILILDLVLIVLGVYCYRRRRRILTVLITVLITTIFLIYATSALKLCFPFHSEEDLHGVTGIVVTPQCCFSPPPSYCGYLYMLLPWTWGGR